MQFVSNYLQQKILNAPLNPGCYLYKNKNQRIIYVGKAKIIRNRVKSYFVKTNQLDPKIKVLVSNIADVEFITTDSELEALLLETNLIKKYNPKYNSDKKDDKSYLWIMIDKNEDFPRLKVVREQKVKNAVYFGPYTSSIPIKRIIKSLRKIFPYRSCNRTIKQTKQLVNGKLQNQIISSDPKPCLYYYLNLCQAPCAGKINKTDYKKNINNISLFLKNKKTQVNQQLESSMKQAAMAADFEKAAIYRDKMQDLEYISQRTHIKTETDDISFTIEKQNRNIQAVNELISKINYPDLHSRPGFKIECYDISNIQGTNAVGSMTVFVDGKERKDLYRKFKIKSKSTPDDFFMLQEVIARRLNQLKLAKDISFATAPDLMIIDGGKGQLSSVYEILRQHNSTIPVVGLAKRFEDIFTISEINGQFKFLKKIMSAGSESRFLVQRIRDETHRFGIAYHRKLRLKGQTRSALDQVPGIGKVVKRKLLDAFGSSEAIKKASAKDLQQIIKNKTTVANLKKLLSRG